jgi:hypothetical protein
MVTSVFSFLALPSRSHSHIHTHTHPPTHTHTHTTNSEGVLLYGALGSIHLSTKDAGKDAGEVDADIDDDGEIEAFIPTTFGKPTDIYGAQLGTKKFDEKYLAAILKGGDRWVWMWVWVCVSICVLVMCCQAVAQLSLLLRLVYSLTHNITHTHTNTHTHSGLGNVDKALAADPQLKTFVTKYSTNNGAFLKDLTECYLKLTTLGYKGTKRND